MSVDFWGVVVPTWLGALGTIAASTVALFAYLAGRSAQGGVKQLANGLNRANPPRTEEGASSIRQDVDPTPDAEPWSFEQSGSKVTFRNATQSTAVVERVMGEGVPLTQHFSYPVAVPPSAGFEIIVHRILGGPAVAGLTIEWTDDAGRVHSRTYYL